MPGYTTLKLLHLSLVACSGGLFLARGLGVLTGGAWPMHLLARRASVAIDTALLTAGATLWAWGGWHPLQQPWLGTKLALLLVYIGLGTLALKRARPGWPRAACLLAALAVYACMVSVAMAHHPLGWWHGGA